MVNQANLFGFLVGLSIPGGVAAGLGISKFLASNTETGAVINSAVSGAVDTFVNAAIAPDTAGKALLASTVILAAGVGKKFGPGFVTKVRNRVQKELAELRTNPNKYYYDQLAMYYDGTLVPIELYRKETKVFDPLEELKIFFGMRKVYQTYKNGHAVVLAEITPAVVRRLNETERKTEEERKIARALWKNPSIISGTIRRLCEHIALEYRSHPDREKIFAERDQVLETNGFDAEGRPKEKVESPAPVPIPPPPAAEGDATEVAPADIGTLAPAPEGLVRHIAPYLNLREIKERLHREDADTLTLRLTEMKRNFPNGDDGPHDKPEPAGKKEAGNTFVAAYQAYAGNAEATAPLPEREMTWRQKFAADLKISPALLEELYWLYGGGNPVCDDYSNAFRLGRFYLSLKAEHAAEIWQALQSIYEVAKNAGIIFHFKIGTRLDMYARGDVGVIYFLEKDQEAMYSFIQLLWTLHPDAFKDRIPLFAAQMLHHSGRPLTGISFGQDPGPGQSFGGKRADAITQANREIRRQLEAGESLTTEDAFKLMAHYLNIAGVDIEHPAFDHGGIEMFRTLFTKSDQQ